MRNRIIVIVAIMAVLGLSFWGIKGMLNKAKEEADRPNQNMNQGQSKPQDNPTDTSKNDGEVIVVTIDSHEKLFKSTANVNDFDNRPTSGSGIELEIVYRDEEENEIKKKYAIEDSQLKEDYLKYHTDVVGYSESGYEEEGVYLSFDNESINQEYKLVVPEEFKGRKVLYLSFVNDIDDNLVEIEYPASCSSISIARCTNLKKLSFGKNARYININQCRQLTDVSEITSQDCVSIGNTFNKIPLEKYNIPDSILAIRGSFCDLENTTEINLSNNILMIKDSFNNSQKLTKIDIPDSVSAIWNSFNNCGDLTLIVGEGTVGEKYAKENELNYEYRK